MIVDVRRQKGTSEIGALKRTSEERQKYIVVKVEVPRTTTILSQIYSHQDHSTSIKLNLRRRLCGASCLGQDHKVVKLCVRVPVGNCACQYALYISSILSSVSENSKGSSSYPILEYGEHGVFLAHNPADI